MAVYFGLVHEPAPDFSANGGTWIVALPSGERRGLPEISQDCASFREFSRQIDHLQADLERLRSEGQQHFGKLDEERSRRHA